MNKFAWRMWIFLLTLCSVVMLGCSAHLRNPPEPETHDQRAVATSAAIGHNEEQKGVMSSADYLRWEEVGKKVSAGGHVNDDEINWALSMMQKPSTHPAQVNVMMMGLFLSMHRFEPVQQQKVRTAVTPLLTSNDPVERDYAKAVIYGRHRHAH